MMISTLTSPMCWVGFLQC